MPTLVNHQHINHPNFDVAVRLDADNLKVIMKAQQTMWTLLGFAPRVVKFEETGQHCTMSMRAIYVDSLFSHQSHQHRVLKGRDAVVTRPQPNLNLSQISLLEILACSINNKQRIQLGAILLPHHWLAMIRPQEKN